MAIIVRHNPIHDEVAMRILLVEDELDLARALISALERHDILVDHVSTLEMALEAVENAVHSIAVLDRKLPDGDSLTIIPQLRRAQAGLPIIVLSALGSPSIASKASKPAPTTIWQSLLSSMNSSPASAP